MSKSNRAILVAEADQHGGNKPYKTIIKNCEICGSEFYARLSRVKQGYGRFCSRKCADVWHSKVMTEKNALLFKKVKCICKECGCDFFVKPSRVKKGNGKFCSAKCQGKWQSKNKSKENSPFWKGGFVTRKCKICEKEFLAKPSHDNKFCSRKCSSAYRSQNYRGENHPLWKGGTSFIPYPIGWKKELKEQIRNRDKNKCFLCERIDKKQKLSVHHIDYDKDNLSPRNLISLCNKCHTKTNHDREHWITVFDTLCEFRKDKYEIQ